MSDRMAQRVQSFGTSIFTEISALAVQHQAVNLGQGFPDFAGPALIKEAAIKAIQADQNQYAPSPGLLLLREAISQSYAHSYGLNYDPQTEITITSGATEALIAAMLSVVDPGDEVIFFEPAYDAYLPDIIMAGGQPRPVRLRPPSSPAEPRWRLDADELRATFGPRTRALVLNSPQNPTGKVFARDELELIAQLCQKHDVIAITDEVYDRLVFQGEHIPLASLPGMRDRTITINSTGKTFSVTGWKIGYALTTPALTDAVRRSHQFITFATSTPFQAAAAAALSDAVNSSYYADLRHFYGEQRTRLQQGLQKAGFEVYMPQGSYFMLAALPAGWNDDAAFCRYLTTEIGVAAIPLSVFYSDPGQATHFARFCFAKSTATINAAVERLVGMQRQR
ncbi:MAG: aminotransferase class I/II-fold pyridoxal phosphate-dependent enzyme [Herpetosiphonaceae bacterium]|nr:aminotransferase class I/II-fold pyridoxal phosphate-dependent enzyme [Herpetosiphonaceae bacterium]